MSDSLSIIQKERGAKWRMEFANRVFDNYSDGEIYLQDVPGTYPCIIHSCQNMGAPWDAESHRYARRVWDRVLLMARPKTARERGEAIEQLRIQLARDTDEDEKLSVYRD